MFCCGYYICITLLLWVAPCLENCIWSIISLPHLFCLTTWLPRLLSSCFSDYFCITILLWVAGCLENSIDILFYFSFCILPHNSLCLGCCRVAFMITFATRFCCELLFASRIVFDIWFYFSFCILPHNSLCLGCCRVAFLTTFASCFLLWVAGGLENSIWYYFTSAFVFCLTTRCASAVVELPLLLHIHHDFVVGCYLPREIYLAFSTFYM
jgi:hypothetical protein